MVSGTCVDISQRTYLEHWEAADIVRGSLPNFTLLFTSLGKAILD